MWKMTVQDWRVERADLARSSGLKPCGGLMDQSRGGIAFPRYEQQVPLGLCGLTQEIHFLAFSHEGFIWALGRESDGLLASILPFRLGYQEP